MLGEFLAATSDRIDVQAGDEAEEAVAAVADFQGLQGHVPPTLLLVEATKKQVHAPMQFLFGPEFLGLTMLTLTLAKGFRGHAESSSGFGMKI